MNVEESVCIRPDGRICGHGEESHHGLHALSGELYCLRCAIAEGMPLYGPYVHGYNPCIWSGIGWLPLSATS